MEPHAFAYLDDIIVIGTTLEEHLENLREVLEKTQQREMQFFPAEHKEFGTRYKRSRDTY